MTSAATATPDAAAAPAVKPVPRWALHRRLYDWVISFADRKHASIPLFILAFMESSFFPVPPDVLLGPMCLGARRRSMWFATICTMGSVMGAFLGYFIGLKAIHLALMIPGVEMGPEIDAPLATVNGLKHEFALRGQWYVFIAALTPIPFKLLTITAGFAKMNLGVFALACLIGRSLRFYFVAGVFWLIGPRAVPFIDKYFNLLCLIFVILLIGGFVVIKLVH
ncbi:MAG TPA: DedA family protein [Phycisphaeraceae bacterium]|nr:DedA family protein [Phycisphaeraceae bacterium]